MNAFISKTRVSVGNHPYLNGTLPMGIALYKILKYDAIGGISSRNWDIVFISSKEMLHSGLKTYLICMGYNKVTDFAHQHMRLFAEANPDLYETAYRLMLSNAGTQEEIEKLHNDIVELVENNLFPEDVWDYFGRNTYFSFANLIDTLIDLEKMSFDIGWMADDITDARWTYEQWKLWKDITNRVFLKDIVK